MKDKYIEPKMEVLELETESILATSDTVKVHLNDISEEDEY